MSDDQMRPSTRLRWSQGILQQAWLHPETRTVEWRAIPGDPPAQAYALPLPGSVVWMSTQEVVAWSHAEASPRTLYDLRKKGTIPSWAWKRFGGKIYYRADFLDRGF